MEKEFETLLSYIDYASLKNKENVDEVYEALEHIKAETERLNTEIWKMASKQSGYEHFLRKENAKLKCLALHGMFGFACAKMNVLAEVYKEEFESGMVHKDFSRWHRLSLLWLKAYRKAKTALKEGK